jgi:hypothetical protein
MTTATATHSASPPAAADAMMVPRGDQRPALALDQLPNSAGIA